MRNNIRIHHILLAGLTFLGLPSCGSDSKDGGGGGDEHDEHDGHDHGAEEDGEHGDGHDHDSGETHDVGSVTAAGTTLAVTAGHLEAGSEADVDLEVSSGAVPASIRVWVGLESGVGSLKVKADRHEDHFHAHLEIPEDLGVQSRLWVQVESDDGEMETQGLAIPDDLHED